MFVHEAYRGRGLGRDLVAFALDTARARGATRCVLDTNEVNATAIALYESMGFTCVRAYGADRGRHLFYAKDPELVLSQLSSDEMSF